MPFIERLAAHGEQTAVITSHGSLTYRELAERVDPVAKRLGTSRRLVLVAGANELDPLVTYLGALAGGHPVLLAAADNRQGVDALVAAYDPDVVAGPLPDGWVMDERRDVTAHDLHPDLALLLSTSGSTGSPKLVRHSQRNLQANAESIAEYLGISNGDRAATTLPLHYCYGLSVVHSHLLRGAGLFLTGLSVVDACFWDLFKDARGTTFAGVPHTFELLGRVGFDRMRLPSLRYVTQAGGRLDPQRVGHFAELGRRQGWDFVVMYGQTEATARMAYLPPDLAASNAHTSGFPIPGGTFTIQPVPEVREPGAGELVYHGPNVMLGYAETPADLRLGRTVGELRTGDLARQTPDGLYEIVGRRSRFVKIVGRRSRFVKIVGLRVDLNRVEAMLAEAGVSACSADADGLLAVAVGGGSQDPAALEQRLAERYRLPRRCPGGRCPRAAPASHRQA